MKSDEADLELRQLAKVQKRPDKAFQKIIRLERRKARLGHQAETTRAIGQVTTEAIRAFGNVTGQIARAHGLAVKGWLENGDPVTWGAGAAAMVAYIAWVSIFLKSWAQKLGLDFLASAIPSPPFDAENIRKHIGSLVAHFGFSSPPGPDRPPQPGATTLNVWYEVRSDQYTRFFKDQPEAERAFTLLQVTGFGLAKVRLVRVEQLVDDMGTQLSIKEFVLKEVGFI